MTIAQKVFTDLTCAFVFFKYSYSRPNFDIWKKEFSVNKKSSSFPSFSNTSERAGSQLKYWSPSYSRSLFFSYSWGNMVNLLVNFFQWLLFNIYFLEYHLEFLNSNTQTFAINSSSTRISFRHPRYFQTCNCFNYQNYFQLVGYMVVLAVLFSLRK